MSDEHRIAEKLAAADFGPTWDAAPEVVKRIRIKGWLDLIDNINRAGYRLVEEEDGR